MRSIILGPDGLEAVGSRWFVICWCYVRWVLFGISNHANPQLPRRVTISACYGVMAKVVSPPHLHVLIIVRTLHDDRNTPSTHARISFLVSKIGGS